MKTVIVILCLLPLISLSQKDQSIVKFVNPTSVALPKGYTNTVQVDLGNSTMIIISGQVALDKQGNLVGKGDLLKQTEQTFLNIKSIAEEAGGGMDNVVKITNYLIDLSQVQIFREVRDKFVNMKNPPASTTVQVSRLFREDFLVEVEATLIIPKK